MLNFKIISDKSWSTYYKRMREIIINYYASIHRLVFIVKEFQKEFFVT